MILPNSLAVIEIDHFLNELDRDHHIGNDAINHLRTGELAKIPKWRSRIVVDENVWVRARLEQGGLTIRGCEIGRHLDDLAAGRPTQFGSGSLQRLALTPIDHDLALGMRKRQSAGTAQPAAGRAYNGLATGDSQIHQVLPGSSSGAGLAGTDP